MSRLPKRDTIFALASGSPPSAVALLRISGPSAHGVVASLGARLPDARVASVRKLHHPKDGALLDEALVLRFDAPRSATGEDVVELHLHGGRAVSEGVLAALGGLDGLRLAQPGEFTRRAFENGRIDLTAAEGLADLIEAETEIQRRAALAMAEGGMARQVDTWRNRLLHLSARAEAAIDYAEEEDVAGVDGTLVAESRALAEEIRTYLTRPRAERLRDGIRIVFAGPPNCGKSSIINALTESDRCIVTPHAGTTRDHVDMPVSLGGLPMILTDTAGLRQTDDPVETIGVARARDLIQATDILVWMGDAADAPAHPHRLIIYPRCDAADRIPPPACLLATSSVTGEGLKALVEWLIGEARAVLPREGLLAVNARQAACLERALEALAPMSAADLLPEVAAAQLREALGALDRLSGRNSVEDMLDALFGRFCLGK